MTLENAGAMPSQLNRRTRSAWSRAVSVAVRWMASMPMLAPEPVSMAPTHHRPNCKAPLAKVATTTDSMPSTAITTEK